MQFSFRFKLKWLNDFNVKSRKILGAELLRQGKTDGYKWLMKNTEPFQKTPSSPPTPLLSTKANSGSTMQLSGAVVAFICIQFGIQYALLR